MDNDEDPGSFSPSHLHQTLDSVLTFVCFVTTILGLHIAVHTLKWAFNPHDDPLVTLLILCVTALLFTKASVLICGMLRSAIACRMHYNSAHLNLVGGDDLLHEEEAPTSVAARARVLAEGAVFMVTESLHAVKKLYLLWTLPPPAPTVRPIMPLYVEESTGVYFDNHEDLLLAMRVRPDLTLAPVVDDVPRWGWEEEEEQHPGRDRYGDYTISTYIYQT